MLLFAKILKLNCARHHYRLHTVVRHKSEAAQFIIPLCLLLTMAFLLSSCGTRQIPTKTAVAGEPPEIQIAKIYLSETGIYQVDADVLKKAGLTAAIRDPSNLRLYQRGNEQPVSIQGTGDDLRIYFLGEARDSAYTIENVYWLVSSEAAGWWQAQEKSTSHDIPDEPAVNDTKTPINLPVGAYPAEIRIEENLLYLPQVDQGDHWMWVNLPAPSSQALDFEMSGLSGSGSADESAWLRLALWSSTDASNVTPDHHLVIKVNDEVIADSAWDGQGRQYIEDAFPASILQNGKNTVVVEAPGDTGVAADINYIDWIEIVYPRSLLPENDRLFLHSAGGKLTIGGFSGPAQVFEVRANGDVSSMEDSENIEGDDGYSIQFESATGQGYYIAGPNGTLKPDRIEAAGPGSDLRASDLGADYVAIGPDDLLAAVEPLLTWREEQGLQVRAISLEAIVDQFNFGLPEPQAIQNFIRYAAESWEPAPRYVLLVGDATYDPLGYVSNPEANRVPTFLVDTIFGGQTASDVDFTQVNEDPWPDIPLGRIPAQTPQQVGILVDKTIRYENELLGVDWKANVLAVADGQEPHFKTEAQSFLDLFPESYRRELYAPRSGTSGANEQIKAYFEDDQLVVAYFGHGSVNMWGKDRLFTTEDVIGLGQPEQYPIVLNMTCLTGLFTHPKVESLAESLLWQKEGGAVAVLAPSSLTLPTNQSFLSQSLVEEMIANPDATLGEVHLLARRRVPTDSAGAQDVMHTFMLFGDPALKVPAP